MITSSSNSLSDFYFIIKKNIILTCSIDKTINVYQLPINFPGSLMKEETKNQIMTNSNQTIDIIEERLISQTAVLKFRKSEELNEIEYNEDKINCDDLNGWDYLVK